MGCIAASQNARLPEELHVDVTRASGTVLGAAIREKDGYAVIHSLSGHGLIWDWNLRNPSKKVSIGDTVCAANGASGSYWDVIFELQKTGPMHLVLHRGARARRHRPTVSPEIRELVHMQFRALRPEDYERLRRLDETVQPKDLIPEELVNEFPLHRADECGETECQICLEDLRPDELMTRLPCGHAYHGGCIKRWLTQYSAHCPVCSLPLTDMVPSLEDVAEEAPHASADEEEEMEVCEI
mmetsp:Transcript_3807/g.7582  ORF Transcript_3807/g.7582 Transcript_3807/m.7582 type:complete len:241 (-) Transcript_3807:126-848(-)